MVEQATLPPLKSWQFWSACRRIMGDSFLRKTFLRGEGRELTDRQLQRWSADPRYASSVAKNPMDNLGIVIEALAEIGRMDIARAGVEMLAQKTGCELRVIDLPVPDCTLDDECLDDYPVLVRFHDAIRREDEKEVVRRLWQEAKGELDETFASYMLSVERNDAGHTR